MHHLHNPDLTGRVVRSHQSSINGRNVKALASVGRFSATGVVTLISDLTEELAFLILLSLQVVDVDRNRNEIFIDPVDDSLVCKNGRTARNSIVSDTAQGVAVHCPNENWFSFFLCDFDPFPDTWDPRNLPPLYFLA